MCLMTLLSQQAIANIPASVFYSDKNLDIFSIECVGNNLVVKYNKQVGNAYLVNAGILVLPIEKMIL